MITMTTTDLRSSASEALAEVLVEGARLGLDLGDRQLLDRYQRWRSLDALSVAFATDSLTRIYGIPGEAASAIRRFGMGLVGRISPLRNRLMSATTVSEEYWRAHRHLGFTWEELVDISLMGFKSAFMHRPRKLEMLAQVTDEIAALAEEPAVAV